MFQVSDEDNEKSHLGRKERTRGNYFHLGSQHAVIILC